MNLDPMRSRALALGKPLARAVAAVTLLGALFTSSAHAQGVFSLVSVFPIPLPAAPSDLYEVDIDGDGTLDLVALTDGVVRWLPGNGAAGFLPAQTLLAIDAHDAAFGDLNGDGLVDLVLAEQNGPVSVHLADPLGGYLAGPTFTTGLFLPAIAVADWNADGLLDLVVTRNDPVTSGEVAVYLGDGGGSFPAAPLTTPVGPQPEHLLVVDLDADGDLDIVTGHIAFGQFGTTFGVVRGLPGGALGTVETTGIPGPCTGLASGDLDEDGLEDLVVLAFTPSSFCGSDALVFLQTATGFAAGPTITGACGPHVARLVDMDLDGHLDLVTTDGGDFVPGANWVDIHSGAGDGTLAAPETFPVDLSALGRPSFLDFDADGRTDIALPGFGASLTVYRNESPIATNPFIRGDCNGDGTVTAIADAIYLLTWQFQGGMELPCEAAGDCNGDGSLTAIADAIFLLGYQFNGGAPPPAPFPTCGLDPNGPVLSCDTAPPGGCP